MSAFDPGCFERPPFAWMHPRFVRRVKLLTQWPDPERYDELASEVPRAPHLELPRFVREDRAALRQAGGYEQYIAERHAVPTRPGSWHDFFNMAVWAHFPELRWALNAVHVLPGAAPRDPRNGRTPAQNLATSFDEAGMLVVSESLAVLEDLREVRFKRVFWEQRLELARTTRFYIVGHGLLESLLEPHPYLVARSLLVHSPEASAGTEDERRFRCDARTAAFIASWTEARTRTMFDPIPVTALPGVADNGCAAFYDDPERLPFDPRSRRPAGPSEFLT